mgnify:CR=1 FL=1
MKAQLAAWAAIGLLVFAGSALAHHGWAWTTSNNVELTGVLTNKQRARGAYDWRTRLLRTGRRIIEIERRARASAEKRGKTEEIAATEAEGGAEHRSAVVGVEADHLALAGSPPHPGQEQPRAPQHRRRVASKLTWRGRLKKLGGQGANCR